MNVLRSVALSVLFPRSRFESAAFADALAFLSAWPLHSVEFCYEGPDRTQVAEALARSGLEGIYIAVIPLKTQNLSLCDLDEPARRQAVTLAISCIETAAALGCRSVMINSGRHPGAAWVEQGMRQFERSIAELHEVLAAKIPAGASAAMNLLLEPCDSHLDARNLIGPTALATDLVRRLHQRYPALALTLDTAHIREEGEDFLAQLAQATDCCNHLHFANCVVDDPADPMYGDKHVGYDYPGSAFPPPILETIFRALPNLYGDCDCRIALEILCREPDTQAYFRHVVSQIPWFFTGGTP
jgi:sugar phosphate isomerase/epimerase